MTDLDTLLSNAENDITQNNTSIVDLRRNLLEISDFIESDQYLLIDQSLKDLLQELRRKYRSKINEMDSDQVPASDNKNSLEQIQPKESSPDHQNTKSEKETNKPRDPLAIEYMEEAEKYFYSGRYAEALKNYDKALYREPSWERAKQHREEAENYLRTGYIPPIALPSEAASAFGKAQSAARAGRFEDAMKHIETSKEALSKYGIHRWQEGLEFEKKLQENIDAEKTYLEGLSLFENGNLDDAIERIETAARMTGLPKYSEKAQKLYELKNKFRSILDSISGFDIEPEMIAAAKTEFDTLIAEYGENPAILRIKPQLSAAIPRAISPLKDLADSLYSQAKRATTIDDGLLLAKKAKKNVMQILTLDKNVEGIDPLTKSIDKLISEFEQYQDEINQAFISFENNKNFPRKAAKISQEVRQRFPDDTQIMRLKKTLSPFFLSMNLIKLIGILLMIGITIMIGFWLKGQFDSYVLSLTPTSTPTTTATYTLTPLPTLTATLTPSPSPTITYTPTTTPTVGITIRDVWARNGCYEGYTATGRIPAGSSIEFLPMERRFDNFNRECVLVEYQNQDSPIIGWILLLDIDNNPEENP